MTCAVSLAPFTARLGCQDHWSFRNDLKLESWINCCFSLHCKFCHTMSLHDNLRCINKAVAEWSCSWLGCWIPVLVSKGRNSGAVYVCVLVSYDEGWCEPRLYSSSHLTTGGGHICCRLNTLATASTVIKVNNSNQTNTDNITIRKQDHMLPFLFSFYHSHVHQHTHTHSGDTIPGRQLFWWRFPAHLFLRA